MSFAGVVASGADKVEVLAAELERVKSALAEEARRADALNRIGAAIGSGRDLEAIVQAVVDGGVDLTGAEFGAFFYNRIDDQGESYTLYALSGAPRSAFEAYPMPRNTAVFAPTFGGAGVVRSDDITRDPRYGRNAPYHGMPEGHLPVRSYLAAPVVGGGGEVLGGLFFGHSRAGVFPERLEVLVEGVCGQAAAAIGNMRLKEAAQREETERRRAEIALAASQQRLQLIADAIPILCWMAEAEGELVWFNRRCHEYAGAEPGALTAQTWVRALDPDERQEVLDGWRKAVRDGEPFEGTFKLRGADGIARPFLTRVEPAHDAGTGEITRWFGVSMDIAAETAARERLQFALQAGRLGAWELDVATRTYEASDLCRANYGRKPEDAFTFDDLTATIHPEDRSRMAEAIEAAIATGAEYDIEYRIVLPPGEVRWLHVRGRAAQTADRGGVRRMAGVSLDVTERKQGEERQRLLLNELNHRVKNTLATVQSLVSQTLRTAASAEAFRDAFEARLLALSQTHNLLTDQNWQGASLHDILIMELSPHAGRQSGGGARFVLDSDRDLKLSPKAAVALGMAVHELTTNAIKYGALSSPDGRVAVCARSKDKDRLILEWTESGGPAVRAPSRRGFGGRLLEQGLAAELAGRVRLEYDPSGLVCRMDLPLDMLEPAE